MNDRQLNDQVLELIFSVGRLMKGEMKFSSHAANLSMLQIQALLCIEKQSEVQMTDFAASFTITLPTATSLIDNLIKAGFVERQRSTTDRRVVTVRLTSQGKKLLTKVREERSKKIHTMLSYLPHKEKKELFKVLVSLKESLEKVNEA